MYVQVPENQTRSNYRSGYFSSLIALWSKNPLARLYLYLGALCTEFFVWKCVEESHGPEAAIRAFKAIRDNVDRGDGRNALDLVAVTTSSRIGRLAEARSKSEPERLPERLPPIFTKRELSDLGKTIFDFERPFEPVDEIRVPRADLETRLKLCQEVLKESQSSKVALVYTFTDTETVLESVLRVGQAR